LIAEAQVLARIARKFFRSKSTRLSPSRRLLKIARSVVGRSH
jgi:hypothetical protein